ncbi:flavoprotein [Fodinicola acaciae]|uniref:flavoprotein n=1 Tax=Fodinicola acaciae TaxID=2681555 RepID=UPI001FE706C9|nr:flavoprotein [Fodinicola acaciae]
MSDAPVVYVIASAAPPVLDLQTLVALLHERGWRVCIILTPTAATWVNVPELEAATSSPVRVTPRLPQEQDPLPEASAVLVAPATFNLINKWAVGISDNLALGLLNELLGVGLPIVVAPCAKPALRSHPNYAGNLKLLSTAGARFVDSDAVSVRPDGGLLNFEWPAIVTELEILTSNSK